MTVMSSWQRGCEFLLAKEPTKRLYCMHHSRVLLCNMSSLHLLLPDVQVLSGKRKARSEEAEAPSKRGSVARKAVKRAAGLTPSRKGLAPQGTPMKAGSRAAGAGPSRLASAISAADLENTGRVANASSTPLTQV